MKDHTTAKPEPGEPVPDQRRPYRPPGIVSRERLESVAVVCSGPNAKSELGAPSPQGGICGEGGGTIQS